METVEILAGGEFANAVKSLGLTSAVCAYPDMFGKTVFLTCAEAEAAIEARKGGKE